MKPQGLWPLRLYRVNGSSMEPTYREGDLVLGWRWFRPQAGQVIIAQTPERPLLKRVKEITVNDVWLEGDNLNSSTDSRHRGAVQRGQIEAVVIARVARSLH